MNYFRKLYGNSLKFTPALGIVLILLFGIPRFLAVMWANEQRGLSLYLHHFCRDVVYAISSPQ